MSTNAALRLGRYAQAEALARQLVAVPVDVASNTDPQPLIHRASALLAHALAMQGKGDEARTVLQPALAYYEKERDGGAHGTSFRRDYAYALYASAMSRGTDGDGRTKRDAELAEAAKQIAGVSAEAAKLALVREVADLIAAARSGRS